MEYNDVNKRFVLSKIVDYYNYKQIKVRQTKKFTTVTCPFCNEVTANIIPHSVRLSCWKCNKKYTLLEIVKELDFKNEEVTETQVLDYLVEKLELKIVTQKKLMVISELLDFYEQSGFDMVPIVPKTKVPSEKRWTSDSIKHTNKEEWVQWLTSGLNISVKPGKKSNLTILDIDVLSKEEKIILRQDKQQAKEKGIDLTLRTPEFIEQMEKKRDYGLVKIKKELKDVMGNPVIQKTLGGEHWLYQYESSIPKSSITIVDIIIDLENDGGQVVMAPSVIMDEPESRFLTSTNKIPKMSQELLDLITANLPNKPKETNSEAIRDALSDDDFKIDPSKFELINDNLKGCCNLEMIKLGGKFRQNLSPKETEFALKVVNKHILAKPMDSVSINNMCNELEKYYYADTDELEQNILKYMAKVSISTKSDLELAVEGQFTKGEGKKRLNEVLNNLFEKGRIKKVSKNEYKFVKKIIWTDELFNMHKPIEFKVPYFNDVSKFNIGDHIIIGSKTGHGKTILAMNIIKRFVKQGIKPYYIGREGGSRWVEDAWSLGLAEGDFFHPQDEEFFDFNELELADNSVVIYDWYKPLQYSETANDFDKLDKKLKKHKSLALVFVQLREDGSNFAKDQLNLFSAFSCKYIYDEIDKDNIRGEFTKFEINKNRAPRNSGTAFNPILCKYNFKTKEVDTLDEYNRRKGVV